MTNEQLLEEIKSQLSIATHGEHKGPTLKARLGAVVFWTLIVAIFTLALWGLGAEPLEALRYSVMPWLCTVFCFVPLTALFQTLAYMGRVKAIEELKELLKRAQARSR